MVRKALSSTIGSAATVVVLLLVVGGLWAYVFAEQGRAGAAVTPEGSSSSPSSESSSSTSAPVEQTWSMGDAREALALEDSNVLVLGDSTGNGKDEWTSLWAQSMETPVARWDTDTESGYLGESDRTRMWSGAMFKATADYPAEHEEIWPAQDPDLVLLSYGHFHESGEEATAALEELRTDLAKRYPDAAIVVVLQNPEVDDANAATRTAIGDWAEAAGLPTIDVAKAFEGAGSPEGLLADDINPSPEGSQLWAETVELALVG